MVSQAGDFGDCAYVVAQVCASLRNAHPIPCVSYLACACQGKLSISVRRSADNSPLLLRFAARGDCIGESALVVPASRTVTGMFYKRA